MLTPLEVAEKLKVTRKTVYRWIESGKLKAIKIDGIIRVHQEDFDKFVGGGK